MTRRVTLTEAEAEAALFCIGLTQAGDDQFEDGHQEAAAERAASKLAVPPPATPVEAGEPEPGPYIEHGGEVRRGFDCGHRDSWQHVLGTLRYRHANIAGKDVTGGDQRSCATDREAWPCQTVEAIDTAASFLAARLAPSPGDTSGLRTAAIKAFQAEVEPARSKILGPTTVQTLVAAADWERAADKFLEVFLAYDATSMGRNAINAILSTPSTGLDPAGLDEAE